jgi:hypothetical protein
MNRDRESRPRIGSDASFFGDSFSNLEIDDNFRISHNLGLGLAEKISQAFAIQLVRYRETNTPALVALTGTGGAVCKGATPSVEQPGGRGFKPRLRSLLD